MSEYQQKSEQPYEGKPYDSPGEKKKSGCFKGCVIIGIVGVVALVACCVGGVFYIRSGVTTDVAKANDIAKEIINWDFNEEIDAKLGLSMFFARVAIKENAQKGVIFIADTPYADSEDFGKQMDGQLRGQLNSSGGSEEETELVAKGEETLEIKGETCKFSFNHTKGTETDADYWEVIGVVPGNENPTFVMMKLLHSAYDKQAIIDRLNSIK